MRFDQVFTVHPDGSIEPRERVRMGPIEMGPGLRFNKGVSFAGVDLALFVGKDLEVQENQGIKSIVGAYR